MTSYYLYFMHNTWLLFEHKNADFKMAGGGHLGFMPKKLLYHKITYWNGFLTPKLPKFNISHTSGRTTIKKLQKVYLTHWGGVTHICVSKQTIIGSDNGLSPGRRQAIIWTNDGILLIGTLGTNFNQILIEIRIFAFKKLVWKCRLRNGGHFVSASMCQYSYKQNLC